MGLILAAGLEEVKWPQLAVSLLRIQLLVELFLLKHHVCSQG